MSGNDGDNLVHDHAGHATQAVRPTTPLPPMMGVSESRGDHRRERWSLGRLPSDTNARRHEIGDATRGGALTPTPKPACATSGPLLTVTVEHIPMFDGCSGVSVPTAVAPAGNGGSTAGAETTPLQAPKRLEMLTSLCSSQLASAPVRLSQRQFRYWHQRSTRSTNSDAAGIPACHHRIVAGVMQLASRVFGHHKMIQNWCNIHLRTGL